MRNTFDESVSVTGPGRAVDRAIGMPKSIKIHVCATSTISHSCEFALPVAFTIAARAQVVTIRVRGKPQRDEMIDTLTRS